jgi:DNA polymerase-3 subunit chi
MRVDFYHLTRDPAERVLPRIARNTMGAGERLLVVSDDRAQLDRISAALWQEESFLAHGPTGGAHDARQPILLGQTPDPANGARFLALADGQWREAAGMARVFLLFGPEQIDAARGTWRLLGQRDGVDRHYWRQDGGKWFEGP